VSDDRASQPLEPRVREFVNGLLALSASDQALVLALIARLREIPRLADEEFPSDVTFMDFEE
jgi:hypothetical protein